MCDTGCPALCHTYCLFIKFNRFFTDNDFPLYGSAGVTGKF